MRAGTRHAAVLNQPTGQTLLHDTFTDTNAVSLDAHVIRPVNKLGVSWVEAEGNFDINTNRARAAANYSYATVDAGTPDVQMSFTFTMNGQIYVVGRYQDASYKWVIELGNTSVKIQELQPAAITRATASVTLTNGVDYTVSATFSGDTISCTVNGVTVSYTGAAARGTRFGFSLTFTNSYVTEFELATVGRPGAGNINLRSGLVAYWPMDEASGDRADAHGGHTLTDAASAASNTGKVYANALDLPLADNKALTTAGADFEFGDAPFTIGLWLYPYSLPEINVYRPVMALNYASNVGGWEIKLAYNAALAFGVKNTSGTVGFAHAQNCVIDNWHCALFWHDPVANTVNGSRNNLGPEVRAWSGGMTTSGTVLTVGAYAGLGETDYRLGPVAIWRRLLTAAEKARWLNWGAGLPYAGA